MDQLTGQEVRVALLTAHGLTNGEIGECADLSINTVKAYLASLQSKLGARNRSHVVAVLMMDPAFRRLATDRGHEGEPAGNGSAYDQLSDNARQVAVFGAHGHTCREVGELRYVSAHTVRSRRKEVFRLLGVPSMVAAVGRLMPDERFRALYEEHVMACPVGPDRRTGPSSERRSA